MLLLDSQSVEPSSWTLH